MGCIVVSEKMYKYELLLFSYKIQRFCIAKEPGVSPFNSGLQYITNSPLT